MRVCAAAVRRGKGEGTRSETIVGGGERRGRNDFLMSVRSSYEFPFVADDGFGSAADPGALESLKTLSLIHI